MLDSEGKHMINKSSSESSVLLRVLLVTLFALSIAACGGSSTPAGDASNPDGIDANQDGFIDGDDDINGDGVVDNDDVIAFNSNPDSFNPSNIDANQDGILDFEDDINGDGFVDNDDVIAFGGSGPVGSDPNAFEGNILPDCNAVDCDSANDLWLDNAVISQNRSPQSTYVLGIQRMLFCLRVGSTENSTLDVYADGIYGSGTAADMLIYQDGKNLLADGIVGEDTWDALQRDVSFLIPSADGVNDLYAVTSTEAGCENLAQFAQQIAAPSGWQLVSVPGGNTYVPFSVNYSDLLLVP